MTTVKNEEYYTNNSSINVHIDNIISFRDFLNTLLDEVKSGEFNTKMIKDLSRTVEKFYNEITYKDPFQPGGSKSPNQENNQGISGVLENNITGSYASVNGENFINQYENFANNQPTNDPTTCIKKDKLTAQDLLPKDVSNLKWAQTNPSSIGDITDQNFLTAGYHIGVNTIGQTLKNANLQLRSEIPNPQVAVSPWMISTIEPDTRSTTLEIGSAPTY